jgi:ATP-dependent helicase HrpB
MDSRRAKRAVPPLYSRPMQSLPIDASLPQITATLRSHSSLVLVAAPGAGKTTRVPPAIIRDAVLQKDSPHLIMLQPRRVAARAAAERIAEEQKWRLGEEVGYHIRLEKRYTPRTGVRILTEAILTRMLLGDPALEGIGCVLLDEFHERSIHSDLALAFLREVQQTIRPDLKIVVMSATLEAGPVAAFLGGAPVINVEGRVFPVDVAYRPRGDRPLDTYVADIVDEALSHEGDVLAFLPGVGEIDRVRRALGSLGEGIQVLPLHGSLSSEEQQRALRPAAAGRRKIILATNIAETSLTIDGVRIVIDSGLARVASFDPGRGMNRLDLERISKASTTQRAGRAGRQAPGKAFRLWSETEQKHLADYNVPEIHRIDLASAILAVHAWEPRDARTFPWFDLPEEPLLVAAEDLLRQLGALSEKGSITEDGRQMLQLPAHPRIARLLLSAIGTPLLEEAVTLAAILEEDARSSGAGDLLAKLHRPAAHLDRAREQLTRIARQLAPSRKPAIQETTDLLLLAFPDRIARRRGNDPHAGVMVGGMGVRLSPEALTPAIAAAPLFLALDPHHAPGQKKSEAVVRTAVAVPLDTIARLFPGEVQTRVALEYDTEKEKVIAFTRRQFRDLVLAEDPHGRVDPELAGPVLAAALWPAARDLFLRDERAARLLARIALLRHAMPEQNWPLLDAVWLGELLTAACAGKRSLAELRDGNALSDAIRSALAYPLDRQLDQFAPETLQVPSGSNIKLDYSLPTSATTPPPTPVLAVRLQELFGLTETPRIAGGRLPVLLHLLSPGYKPMQITSDLKSFWSSAYFEVRKDLRVRYPKHKWPDDPLTAQPEAKGRRR